MPKNTMLVSVEISVPSDIDETLAKSFVNSIIASGQNCYDVMQYDPQYTNLYRERASRICSIDFNSANVAMNVHTVHCSRCNYGWDTVQIHPICVECLEGYGIPAKK